jgi:glycosyltransferase involved in cell wall biosynthesis
MPVPALSSLACLRHVGISFGRVAHWYDGLGEFSQRLGSELAARAPELRARDGIALHFHLPVRWHGRFGANVGYLDLHTLQRFVHWRAQRFALWHTLHQHIRLLAPLRTQARVETVHDLNFLHTKQGAKRERYRSRLRRRLARRQRVIAISAHVADDIRRELAPLQVPLHIVHNGVTDWSTRERSAIAALDDGVPFLLHISRMAPSKNIAALIDLAAAWRERRFVFAGADGPYVAEVQRLLAARRLDNVQLAIDIDEREKAWLYAQCEAFLFPSWTEGFGLPPLEAMCFGKPVFLSRLTSLPEVGGDAAYYFDGFDGAAMRRTVEIGLARHVAEQRAPLVLAQAKRFSWSRCADEYVAQYRDLLAASANGADTHAAA